MKHEIDIGHDHFIAYFRWAPDDLPANREHFGYPLPVVEKAGVFVRHPNLKVPGELCESAINFDIPEMVKAKLGAGHVWQVHSFDPLTVSPSLLCMRCGDHGFIRDGRWVPA